MTWLTLPKELEIPPGRQVFRTSGVINSENRAIDSNSAAAGSRQTKADYGSAAPRVSRHASSWRNAERVLFAEGAPTWEDFASNKRNLVPTALRRTPSVRT